MRTVPPHPAFAAGRFFVALAAITTTAFPLRAAEETQATPGREEISMTVGRSVILDNPEEVARISISNPEIADAVAVTTKELVLNAKAPGITTLIVWSKDGSREIFAINVGANIQQLQTQIRDTFPGEKIQIITSNTGVSLTGRVSSPLVAEKAAALVAGLGRTVINNLIVDPVSDRQILLKVRFAEVQKSAADQLGANIFGTGALNMPFTLTTGQFSPPRISDVRGAIGAPTTGFNTSFTFSDLLNVFAFRPDLNLGVLIKALSSQNMIEILAEPNLVATSGKEATFLVGGEFPFPVVQGGANSGAITVQFREFGIKLNFLPQILTNDSIKLHVRPEVSSLDFANALTISGFTIPALSTRRVETDVELAAGQSFVIAGLLDQRVTENFLKIPGLSSIPLLGNIFKSRIVNKNNSELLVLVTPEFPSALAAGVPAPGPEFPKDLPLQQEQKKKSKKMEQGTK